MSPSDLKCKISWNPQSIECDICKLRPASLDESKQQAGDTASEGVELMAEDLRG